MAERWVIEMLLLTRVFRFAIISERIATRLYGEADNTAPFHGVIHEFESR